jgi:Gluconate 2-dehydrogenase subunit 3
LDRREALKFLAAGAATAALPPQVLAAFREIHANLPRTPVLGILNAHQDATLSAAAELLLPATETPGAKAVRVNEFIDHILADWYSEEDRKIFLEGLADMDVRTQKLFGKDFGAAGPDQQAEVFRALGDEMAAAIYAVSSAAPGYRGSSPEPTDSFYAMFRELTLTGYFTSEIGATQQLHEEIIPGRFDGCVPIAPGPQAKGS